MKSIREIKWAKIVIIILSIQMFNYSFVLPFVVAHTSFKMRQKATNDAVLTHALEDLFHLRNPGNSGQEETPLDSDDSGVEKKVEILAIQSLKKEYLFLGILHLQFIIYNNIAASIYQPELITPPPKLA